MQNYLIRRDGKYASSIIKKEGKIISFSETRCVKNKTKPASHKLNPNDLIYIAEKGGGIYAICKVLEIGDINIFKDIPEALNFYSNNSKNIDELYFFSRIKDFNDDLKKDNRYQLKFQFYKAKMIKTLSPYVPITGKLEELKNHQGIINLEERHINYINDSNSWENEEVNINIPSSLRFYIYNFFSKQKGIGHIIDLDHFVPSSIGGPGNIIQNLIPIGFSLNRYKSDSIPKHLFIKTLKLKLKKDFSKKINIFLNALKKESNFFEKGKFKDFNKVKDLAKEIIQSVHQQKSIKEIKEFYLNILESHHAEYAEIIKKIEKKSG